MYQQLFPFAYSTCWIVGRVMRTKFQNRVRDECDGVLNVCLRPEYERDRNCSLFVVDSDQI